MERKREGERGREKEREGEGGRGREREGERGRERQDKFVNHRSCSCELDVEKVVLPVVDVKFVKLNKNSRNSCCWLLTNRP